jgi:CHAD domain-containing protein
MPRLLSKDNGNAKALKSSSLNRIANKNSFIKFGRKILKKESKQLLKWPQVILKNKDPEAVHKMRVTTRKLRTVLDVYEKLCHRKIHKKVYHEIKDLADHLGAVRDSDVMLEKLRNNLRTVQEEEKSGLQWLIKHISVYHDHDELILRRSLKQLSPTQLRKQLNNCLT